MTIITPNAIAPAAARPAVRPGVTALQVTETLWRVTRPSGAVCGYVERAAGGVRFAARRMCASRRGFAPVGEFWSLEDALDALAAG
ncbi:MAG: hypothetical protein QM635_05390 [Microbacteriaceae bacterium]